MLAEKNTPTSHAGEHQAASALAVRSAYVSSALAGVRADQASAELPAAARLSFFINRPEVDAKSLSDLIIGNTWLRSGDVVHIAEIRQHILTDSDLDAAARVVIGGAA